uniref:Uncharacterized protein n=1 Tax=Anguilla anguilla TaxID=7936 RepID=A0A0E9UU66_ANGAN
MVETFTLSGFTVKPTVLYPMLFIPNGRHNAISFTVINCIIIS